MHGGLSDEVFAHELDELRAHWEDPQYHRQLFRRFSAEKNLDFVAALYRRIRDEEPDRHERAEQAIDELFKAALSTLEVERSTTPRPPNHLRFVALGMISFTLVYLLLSLFHRM